MARNGFSGNCDDMNFSSRERCEKEKVHEISIQMTFFTIARNPNGHINFEIHCIITRRDDSNFS